MEVKSESEVAQSGPTLSDPMDWSLPGSSIHGIFQARVLESGAIAFSESLSHVQLFATPWTVARQAPLSMEFSEHEYWSGLLLPYPGVLPDLGMKLRSSAFQENSLPFELPREPLSPDPVYIYISQMR